MDIPERIFIVPYRDRAAFKNILIENLSSYLEGENNWEIYFSHQNDTRPFNRGATKNIGFLAMKTKYPNHYKDITFIFHDVDTYPKEKGLIDYNTTDGVVKHFYGYEFALGGIFAIKGKDFEKVKGFPNFWGWGFEDNVIQNKCSTNNIKIDRSNFFKIGHEKIHQDISDIYRLVSKGDVTTYKYKDYDDFTFIKNINYEIKDNMININSFEVKQKIEDQDFYMRNQATSGTKMYASPGYRRKNWSMNRIFN